MGTQVLTDAQNAIAGWRRVIGILETPADLDDPGPAGQSLPRGAMDVAFEDVSFGYPGGPLVLREVTEHIESGSRVAVVGETGSGKTTFAKLLTRLMDPTSGAVLLDGVDIRTVEFASLRRRVVLVPQEGFLFDSTLLENVRYGDLDVTRERGGGLGCRARAGGLAGGTAGRPRHPGRPARGVALRRGAPARGAAPRPPRRSRPARPRRGDQCGRPGAGDAHRSRAWSG